jgi:hypothetical protein
MRGNDARRGWDRRKGRRIRRNPAMERRRRRRNPIGNPVSGMMEFVGGVLGVGAGFGLASLFDRIAITHAYSSTNQDAPAQGEIYNSEALLAPIWSSLPRLAWAGGAIVAPLVVARFVNRHMGLKSFFQLMGFGALGRTAGKAVDDLVAKTMVSNASVQRLYSGEIAATAKLNAANLAALSPAPPATFAGAPRQPQRQLAGASSFTGEPTRALGSFSQIPGRAGSLGSTAPLDDDTIGSATFPVLSVPNLQPPQVQPDMSINRPRVMAGTPDQQPRKLFIPALANPDGRE